MGGFRAEHWAHMQPVLEGIVCASHTLGREFLRFVSGTLVPLSDSARFHFLHPRIHVCCVADLHASIGLRNISDGTVSSAKFYFEMLLSVISATSTGECGQRSCCGFLSWSRKAYVLNHVIPNGSAISYESIDV